MQGFYPPTNIGYTKEQRARADALEAEAIRVFGNKSDAGLWHYNLQRDLDGSLTPSQLASHSDDSPARAIAYLHSLGITPQPDPHPRINRRRRR